MKNFSLKRIKSLFVVPVAILLSSAMILASGHTVYSDNSPVSTESSSSEQEDGGDSSDESDSSPGHASESSQDPNDLKNIVIWWEDYPDSMNFINQVIADFREKNPGLDRDFIIHAPTAQDRQALELSILSGTAPNIMKISQQDVFYLGRSGFLLDLAAEPYNLEKHAGLFDSRAWSLARDGDAVYGLPFDLAATVIVYNRELLQEEGLLVSDEELPRTFDELQQLFDKISSLDREDLYVYGDIFTGITAEWFYILWGVGSDIYTPDGRKAAFNNENTGEALASLAAFREKYRIAPDSPLQSLLSGRTAVSLANQGELGGLEDEKFIVKALPQVNENIPPYSEVSLNSLVVLDDRANKGEKNDLSVKFIEFLATSPEYAAEYCRARNLTPALKELLKQEPFNQGNYKIFTSALDYGRLRPDMKLIFSDDVKIAPEQMEAFFSGIANGSINLYEILPQAELLVNQKLEFLWEKWDQLAREKSGNPAEQESPDTEQANNGPDGNGSIWLFIVGGLLLAAAAGGFFLLIKKKKLNFPGNFSRKNMIIAAMVALTLLASLFTGAALYSSDKVDNMKTEGPETPGASPLIQDSGNYLEIWWDQDLLSSLLLSRALEDFYRDKPQYRDVSAKLLSPASQDKAALELNISAGTAPDVVRIQHFYLEELFRNGMILDLAAEPYEATALAEIFHSSVWPAVTSGHSVMGLPLSASVNVMVYNRAVLDLLKAGVPVKYADTMALLDRAGQFAGQDEEFYGYGYRYYSISGDSQLPLQLFLNLGGRVLEANFSRAAVNSKDSVNAVKKMLELYGKNVAGPLSEEAFFQGRAVMMEFSPRAIERLLEDDGLVSAPLPEFSKGKPARSMLTVETLAVVTSARQGDGKLDPPEVHYRKKVAYEFIKYFSTGQQYVKDYNMSRHALPVLLDVLETAPYTEYPYQVFVSQLEKTEVMPQSHIWLYVEEVLDNVFRDMFRAAAEQGGIGDAEIKGFLNKAAEEINGYLKQKLNK